MALGTVERNMRAEFTRLRDMAKKRIDRLQKSGLISSHEANEMRLEYIPKLRSMTAGDVPAALQALKRFIDKKESTVSGARKEIKKKQKANVARAETLGIRKESMPQFGKYMDWLKAKAYNNIFDSEQAVKVFKGMEDTTVRLKNIDVDSVLKDFKFWHENIAKLKYLAQIPDDIRAMIEKKGRGAGGTQTSRQLRNQLKRIDELRRQGMIR